MHTVQGAPSLQLSRYTMRGGRNWLSHFRHQMLADIAPTHMPYREPLSRLDRCLHLAINEVNVVHGTLQGALSRMRRKRIMWKRWGADHFDDDALLFYNIPSSEEEEEEEEENF